MSSSGSVRICLSVTWFLALSTAGERQLMFLHATARSSGALEKKTEVAAPGQAPGFFGVFDGAESNFDDNADTEVRANRAHYLNGHDFPSQDDYTDDVTRFHEHPSGFSKEAWGTVPSPEAHPSWRMSLSGAKVQDYVSPSAPSRNPLSNAEWFNDNVNHFDTYGRQRQPFPETARAYTAPWVERSVNTTLTCETPGCTGWSLMEIYDASSEEIANCHMSFAVHPTDFDDFHSGERVEFIDGNDARLHTDCFPMQSSCSTVDNPVFYCLMDTPVTPLVNKTDGTFNVSAKISDVVEECPYEGNLLSAIPMVTCMVRPSVELKRPNNVPASPKLQPATVCQDYSALRLLQCPERGCNATAQFDFEDLDLALYHCFMSVSINQTDFDRDQGTDESVQWVNISGVTAVSNVLPGQNPCGCSDKSSISEFPLLQSFNVTDMLRNQSGIIDVVSKISDYVDECPSQGHLLDGTAELTCTCIV